MAYEVWERDIFIELRFFPCKVDIFGMKLTLFSWFIIKLNCQELSRIEKDLWLHLASVWHLVKIDIIIDILSNINDYSFTLFPVCL